MSNHRRLLVYFLSFFSTFGSVSLSGQNFGFQFARNKKSVTIPFEYANGFIIIKANLNDKKPVKLIFDTGAQHLLLFNKTEMDQLGLQYKRRYPLVGSDMNKPIFAHLSLGIRLNIGRKIIDQYNNILVLEEDYFQLSEFIGLKIDGIIGAGIFKNLVFEINYRKKYIRFHRPSHFKAPSKKYQTLELEVKRGKPYLQATVTMPNDTVIATKLLLDTGAALSLLLHTNAHKDLKTPKKFIKGKLALGLGGFLRGYQAKVTKIGFSDFQFNDLVTNFQDYNTELDTSFLNNRHGIIGNDLLSRFTAIFDYPNQKLYLKPRRNYQKPIAFDKSGLILIAAGNNLEEYVVNDVVPLSPASRAGLLPNDQIIKVGWIPARWYTLKGLTKKFQAKAGKKLNLTILRNGKKLKFSFKLRSLL
ncbi:MAG: aspartyl protease family protein [Saprospiraceae bacterium]